MWLDDLDHFVSKTFAVVLKTSLSLFAFAERICNSRRNHKHFVP